jgi:hypothetical protein
MTVADQEALEVVQDEWLPVDTVRVTERAGACVLLAAHNEATGAELLGHFSRVAKDLTVFRDHREGRVSFDQALPAIANLGPRSNTTIWLGGTALEDALGPTPEELQEERGYVEASVATLGLPPSAVILDWTAAPYNLVHARLQAPAGLLTVQFETFDYGAQPLPL